MARNKQDQKQWISSWKDAHDKDQKKAEQSNGKGRNRNKDDILNDWRFVNDQFLFSMAIIQSTFLHNCSMPFFCLIFFCICWCCFLDDVAVAAITSSGGAVAFLERHFSWYLLFDKGFCAGSRCFRITLLHCGLLLALVRRLHFRFCPFSVYLWLWVFDHLLPLFSQKQTIASAIVASIKLKTIAIFTVSYCWYLYDGLAECMFVFTTNSLFCYLKPLANAPNVAFSCYTHTIQFKPIVYVILCTTDEIDFNGLGNCFLFCSLLFFSHFILLSK